MVPVCVCVHFRIKHVAANVYNVKMKQQIETCGRVQQVSGCLAGVGGLGVSLRFILIALHQPCNGEIYIHSSAGNSNHVYTDPVYSFTRGVLGFTHFKLKAPQKASAAAMRPTCEFLARRTWENIE